MGTSRLMCSVSFVHQPQPRPSSRALPALRIHDVISSDFTKTRHKSSSFYRIFGAVCLSFVYDVGFIALVSTSFNMPLITLTCLKSNRTFRHFECVGLKVLLTFFSEHVEIFLWSLETRFDLSLCHCCYH